MRGADNSLDRQGKKQYTANILVIYSIYSPRISIHFLARCSNFGKPLKKKKRIFSVQSCLRGSIDQRVGRKLSNFQILFFFLNQVGGGSQMGRIRRIGWVVKILDAQLG